MIDYYETKTHPITKKMVLEAYKQVKSNGGSAGIDDESINDFERNLSGNLYRIWNRMTSGSYYPPAVKEVKIPKKSGGFRGLGIPTVADRVAQQVVRTYLEPLIENSFHEDSYGYRPGKNAHQALSKAMERSAYYSWAIDLDIKGYFDSINHNLMMKALNYYTQEKWVLTYVERWLNAEVMKEEGLAVRTKGTPQGSVLSALLSNVYLHFTFDLWMKKNYPRIPFERYCDDIIVHCRSEKQALFIKAQISNRMNMCKLELNESKTHVVFCKNEYHNGNFVKNSFEFLGHTLKPRHCKTKRGFKLLFTACMSSTAKKAARTRIKELRLKQLQIPIQRLAAIINPITRGWMNYYCKFNKWATGDLWRWINQKIVNWIMEIRRFSKKRAHEWLKGVYNKQPCLLIHWQLIRP